MDRRRLTRAETRVYEALVRIGEDGWPVSVRDIRDDLGYASTASPHYILISLVEKGWAVSHPRSVRGGWRAVVRAA